jgi:hypothetical protein
MSPNNLTSRRTVVRLTSPAEFGGEAVMAGDTPTAAPAPGEREPYPGPALWAFADASGDPHLDTSLQGVSKYFVICAVLVPNDALAAVRSSVDRIREECFRSAEMKSSGIGGNSDRRLRVLTALADVEYRFSALIVDKSALDKASGLAFKRSFLKFLHRVLFEQLFRAHPGLRLRADGHGGPKFMSGFEDYVRDKVTPDLFTHPDFGFASSDTEPLIQLADVLAGTMRRVFEEAEPGEVVHALGSLIRRKALTIRTWPPSARPITVLGNAPDAHDETVRAYCWSQAELFLHSISDDDEAPEKAAQSAALAHLMTHYAMVSDSEYVSTDRLLEVIADAGLEVPNVQQFRARVIAKLRDGGVIVASSSRGYKIPCSVRDLMAFVNLADSIVYPMLNRVQTARDKIRLTTNGGLDILGEERFEYLRALLDRPLQDVHDRPGDLRPKTPDEEPPMRWRRKPGPSDSTPTEKR